MLDLKNEHCRTAGTLIAYLVRTNLRRPCCGTGAYHFRHARLV